MNAIAIASAAEALEDAFRPGHSPALVLWHLVSHNQARTPIVMAAIRFVRERFRDQVMLVTAGRVIKEIDIHAKSDGVIVDLTDREPIADVYMLLEGGRDVLAWLHRVPGSSPTKLRVQWPDKVSPHFVVPARKLTIQGRVVGRIPWMTWEYAQ